MPLKNKELRKLYNHNYYAKNKDRILLQRKNRKVNSKDLYFKQYRKMIEKSAWIASRFFNHDVYDLRSQAYLIFCEALETYDPSKAQFGTYLYNRLRTINDYCLLRQNKKYPSIDSKDFKETPINTYNKFECAIEYIESKVNLSNDAQAVLSYITNREWEDVEDETKRLPRYSEIKRVYNNWNPSRTKKAWMEIKDWWTENKYICAEA